MRKLDPTDLELKEHRRYYSRIYYWSSDCDQHADGREFLYDKAGRFIGVDYLPRNAPPLSFEELVPSP